MRRILVLLAIGTICLSGCGGGGSQCSMNATYQQGVRSDSDATDSDQAGATDTSGTQSNTQDNMKKSSDLDSPPSPPDFDEDAPPPIPSFD